MNILIKDLTPVKKMQRSISCTFIANIKDLTRAIVEVVCGIQPDRKIGLSSLFALSKASCPHEYLRTK